MDFLKVVFIFLIKRGIFLLNKRGEKMKKTLFATMVFVGLNLNANDHLPSNYSMYQANFLFNCPVPEKCFAAFDKYMNTPTVKKEKFEVDFYAIQQNGWDESTHGVSWYYKDADQYAKAGEIYSTSKAGREFRKTMNDLGVEIISDTLTIHSVGVTLKGETVDNGVSLRWSLEVQDPVKFVPLWKDFSKSLEKYDWSSNAYGLQTHYLGNNGTGITHEVWAAFNTPQDALAFLSGMNNSKEFAAYAPEARKYSTFKRSYMEVSLKMYNPD